MPVFTGSDTLTLLPAIVLCLFACGTLILDVVGRKVARAQRGLLLFGLCGLVITGFSLWRQWSALAAGGLVQYIGAQGAVTLDGLGFFSNSLVLGSTVLLFLTSYRFLELSHEHSGEYYSLALFAQAGMYFMATASELITLFLGLELTSISFYILVGFTRVDRRSNEAALKYLLLGAVSSGFILYGFSLLYGIAGSTELADISSA
ncbi:MAG TPA: proton-conducting transporter membrane subunit, partial [Bryobacteraceae bacterium]|nr:proton-conducting transporter membrane subunit [Bryobacteraceae bacterium]